MLVDITVSFALRLLKKKVQKSGLLRDALHRCLLAGLPQTGLPEGEPDLSGPQAPVRPMKLKKRNSEAPCRQSGGFALVRGWLTGSSQYHYDASIFSTAYKEGVTNRRRRTVCGNFTPRLWSGVLSPQASARLYLVLRILLQKSKM